MSTNIAMWSGPRNISTAMMYSFGNRPDCVAWDEPFYAFSLVHHGNDHPMRDEIIAADDSDWDSLVARCLADAGKPVSYQKHMTHHMLKGWDRAWIKGLTNAFLIRAPERVLTSYTRKWSDVTLRDIGFDGVLIVHDADGSATSVGEPAMCFNSAELLAELRAEPVFSDSLRAGNNRWIAPITSPGRDHMWGAFVLAAPEGLEPKPFDHFVIDRSRQLAALAFSNAQDHRELRRAATHDHLTGVLSRGEFESQIERLVGRGELPVVVLFIDLDGFKAVNDSWGHHQGDEVLVAVAARLQEAVRPPDAVPRLGGDEFAILCRGLQPHQARPTVERISRSLMTPIELSQGGVQIGASIGIATAQHPNQIDGLLQRADAEMYRLKRLRRAC